MDKGTIISEPSLGQSLSKALASVAHDRLFALADATTRELCWPRLGQTAEMCWAKLITIAPTDDNKTLSSLAHVWEELQAGGATRHSLLLNVGGGMVTDLGGFAASTFKRGMAYVNVPTTLLAMVDASVGGKTGINFGGLKNEIGVFREPRAVVLDASFLSTMDTRGILSGYAEMVKHALISDTRQWATLLGFDLADVDYAALTRMVAESVAVKQKIVEQDPFEAGMRKALNLGHTAGHALESLAMEQKRTVPHGYAVAWGLVCELYLSARKLAFPQDKLRQTAAFVHSHYGRCPLDCNDYPRLHELMTHDKKNTASQVNFTLLSDIGQVHINQTASKEKIYEMLDFLREG